MIAEQGAGKSTATRRLKLLCDPGGALDGAPPKSPHDLAIAAADQRVITVDNLSRVSQEMSDVLARMATGTVLQSRRLYSDDDVSFTPLAAAAILNGISDFIVRPDLAERVLPLHLSRPTQYRSERRLNAEFEQARPHLLARLCDGLSSAIADMDEVLDQLERLPDAPRMLDCTAWAIASGRAWAWDDQVFLDHLKHAAEDLALAALDSPVPAALLTMLRRLAEDPKAGGVVHRRMSDLVEPLRSACADAGVGGKELDFIPSTGKGMSNLLRRLATPLRLLGWAVDLPEGPGSWEGRGDDRGPRVHIVPPPKAAD
jgi:hypothetical protein